METENIIIYDLEVNRLRPKGQKDNILARSLKWVSNTIQRVNDT